MCVLVAAACQNVEHPPAYVPEPSGGMDAGADGGGITLPRGGGENTLPPEGSAVCGGQRIQAIVDLPNLYFVIDASGSMAEPIRAGSASKYTAAWRSIGNLLRAMGHRFRYGATLFPSTSQEDTCSAGTEVFPLTNGDPLAATRNNRNGPVLQSLLNRLASRAPRGPTPTSATLAHVKSLIASEPGRSHLVLATDGAPNCNLELSGCSSDRCIPDIERATLGDAQASICGIDLSCCDPETLGESAPAQCMDDGRALAEIAELRAASVPTYVIGMPGSEVYRGVLQHLAQVGGTARAGDTAYYAVSDEAELMNSLFEIGTGISIGCTLELESAPLDPALVNVYLDGSVVPSDRDEGWEWSGSRQVTLEGAACATLQSGTVSEVEVVYGCKSVVR